MPRAGASTVPGAGTRFGLNDAVNLVISRFAELDDLVGDSSLARERLEWAPSVDFDGLVRSVYESERAALGAAETELLRLE